MIEPSMLVCTRLVDMSVMHPEQTQELCSKCQHMVGVYPTGQRQLARYSKMKVICSECVALSPGDKVLPAGVIEEIIQEMRDSKPVGKA